MHYKRARLSGTRNGHAKHGFTNSDPRVLKGFSGGVYRHYDPDSENVSTFQSKYTSQNDFVFDFSEIRKESVKDYYKTLESKLKSIVKTNVTNGVTEDDKNKLLAIMKNMSLETTPAVPKTSSQPAVDAQATSIAEENDEESDDEFFDFEDDDDAFYDTMDPEEFIKTMDPEELIKTIDGAISNITIELGTQENDKPIDAETQYKLLSLIRDLSFQSFIFTKVNFASTFCSIVRAVIQFITASISVLTNMFSTLLYIFRTLGLILNRIRQGFGGLFTFISKQLTLIKDLYESIKKSRAVQVIGDISRFLGRFLLRCLNFILTRAEEYEPSEVATPQTTKPQTTKTIKVVPESPPPSQPTAFDQWFDGKGYAVRCPEEYPSRCVKGEFNVGFCVKKKEICLKESWDLSGMGNTENIKRVHPLRVDK
jgi:hypothetical protein